MRRLNRVGREVRGPWPRRRQPSEFGALDAEMVSVHAWSTWGPIPPCWEGPAASPARCSCL
eukprot:9697967-Lingulodinium_polyedra.AAC.1